MSEASSAHNVNITQVATSTTSAEAIPTRPGRRAVTIKNTDAAIVQYIGIGTVTSTNGYPLAAGAEIRIESRAAINALAASGTPRLAYIEEF